MFTSEHWGQRTFLPRIVNNVIRFERRPKPEEERWPCELSHDDLVIERLSDIRSIYFGWQLVTDCQTNILLVIQICGVESMWVIELAISQLCVEVFCNKELDLHSGSEPTGGGCVVSQLTS